MAGRSTMAAARLLSPATVERFMSVDKQAVRERVWTELEDSGEARFPFPPHGRIPNFAGAEEAADALAETVEWREAEVIKANPDAPQLPVRRRALHEGKVVYMAVPRLRGERPFVELDPEDIDADCLDDAATVSSYDEFGRRLSPEEMRPVDLVVSGCVAVTRDGGRVGKGEGFSDLEWALLRELDVVEGDTPTATTVHPIQVVEDDVSVESHDVPMEVVVTEDEVVRTGAEGGPSGVRQELLEDEDLEEMPVLKRSLG